MALFTGDVNKGSHEKFNFDLNLPPNQDTEPMVKHDFDLNLLPKEVVKHDFDLNKYCVEEGQLHPNKGCQEVILSMLKIFFPSDY